MIEDARTDCWSGASVTLPNRTYAIYETEAIFEALDTAGFALLPGALSLEQCEEARVKIDAGRYRRS